MTQPPAGRPRPSASTIIAAVLIFILAVATVVGAVTVFQLPDPVTKEAKDTNLLYEATLAISFLVFFGVAAAMIWAVFRYRRRTPGEIPEQIHGSSSLEATWTIIPIVILVVLFIPSLILTIDLKTPPSDREAEITVEAVGHQWWWEFIYPNDGIRVQQTPPNYESLTPPALVVPVDKKVKVIVRSTDVIHSFGIPNALYKLHAVPGNINLMHFTVEDVGVYSGQCFQFCGLRHSDMRFVLDARSDVDYRRWVSDTRRAQGVDAPSDQASADAGETGRSD